MTSVFGLSGGGKTPARVGRTNSVTPMAPQKSVARPSVKGARILSCHRIPLPDSDRNPPEFGFVTEMTS